MANSLLKPSSSWFMRPQHLKQDIQPKQRSHAIQSPELHIFISPEEEYSIRKYCPLTLNHLLPDLHHTRNEFLVDGLEEFDARLQTRFEKHLEDSHCVLSGSSTSRSEEDSEPEHDSDGTIENGSELPDTNHNPNSRMKVLLLNKVNYPHESIKLQLPDVELNNRRSPSPVFTKSLCTGCINRNSSSANVFKGRTNVERQNNKCASVYLNKVKYATNDKFPCIVDSSQVQVNDIKSSFTKNVFTDSDRKGNAAVCQEMKNQKNMHGTASCKEISSFKSFDSRSRQERRNSISPQLFGQSSCHQECDSQLQVPRERSRSTSPIGAQNHHDAERGHADSIPASPHMLELVRLRKERLRLEERMMLKRRQILEYERLRPPVDKWYEMKDQRFHQEAHRNNVYLKNQNIIPLVEDRRRLLYATITARHRFQGK